MPEDGLKQRIAIAVALIERGYFAPTDDQAIARLCSATNKIIDGLRSATVSEGEGAARTEESFGFSSVAKNLNPGTSTSE